MPAIVRKLGPGTVKIGDVGTEVDFSCQVTAAHVDAEVDEGDEVTVLCGDVIPGSRTYTYQFAGTLLQDLTDDGIVAFSWANKGEEVPFEFVPLTDAVLLIDVPFAAVTMPRIVTTHDPPPSICPPLHVTRFPLCEQLPRELVNCSCGGTPMPATPLT